MKKLFSTFAICFLLVGCGSASNAGYNTSVSEGSKVVITGDKSLSVTKDDIYDYLLAIKGAQMSNGSAQVLNIALTYICEKEITDQAAIEAKKSELVTQYTQYMTNGIDAYAKEKGFSGQDEYINTIIVPAAKLELLKDKYIADHFAELVKEYKVKYLKTITVESESAALEIIKKATDASKIDALVAENSGTDLGMVTTESTLDANILNSLDKFTKDGIYAEAIKTTDNKYVVVQVYNSDTSKVVAEIKTKLTSSSSIKSKYEAFYLKKYEFDVFEDKIKDEIKTTNKDYFG